VYSGRWTEYGGLTYNRWLATALQAMGLPPAEYERSGVRGYGNPFVAAEFSRAYHPGVLSTAGDPLPIIRG
jgi:hypothetical protein